MLIMQQQLRTTLLVVVLCLLQLTQLSYATGRASLARGLLVWPMKLPYPFEFPRDVAASAEEAAKSGQKDAYAAKMCKLLGDPEVLGDTRFSSHNNNMIYPMISSVAQAAYGYSDVVVAVWGQVFAKCNSMSAEGVGYAVAFVYLEGIIDSIGLTKILEQAYKQGGCGAISSIMDVAAAAIKARGTGTDELHNTMGTYSKDLQSCTPKDSEQKFVSKVSP